MKRKIILSSLICCLLSSGTSPCCADESGIPVCPDLRQHEKVLRDGQQAFSQSKNLNGGGAHKFGVAEFNFDPDCNVYRSFDDAATKAEFTSKISDLKLASEEDLSKAARLADDCLFLGQFSDGSSIEKQILDVYDSGRVQGNADDIARALRAAIRCKLLAGCENVDQIKRTSSAQALYRLRTQGKQIFEDRSHHYDIQSYLDLVHRTESGEYTNPAWSEALDLNKRLTQLHPQKATDFSLSCLVALLLEWNKQIPEARDNLKSILIMQVDPPEIVQNTIVGFCQRHDDIALLKQLESSRSQISDSPSTLVSRFLLSERHDTDASLLIRSFILDFRKASRPAQQVMLHAVLDAIKYLNDSDEQIPNEFLVTNLAPDHSLEDEWITRILSESEKKWKNFPVDVYYSYVHNNVKQSPWALRQFALYFASRGEYQAALTAQSALLNAINRTTKGWHDLDQQFTSLTQVKSDLSAPWVMQREQGRILRADLENAFTGLLAEREKRECLEVAAKLDETANDLESRDLFAKAEKMHRESLEIKAKNLGANNPEIANSLLGVARTLAMQQKYKEGDAAYQKVVAFYQTNKLFQDQHYGLVLESYAQMLASAGQKKKADIIYDDARAFYRENDKLNQALNQYESQQKIWPKLDQVTTPPIR